MTETFVSLQSSFGKMEIFAPPKSLENFNPFNWKRSLVLVTMISYTVFLSLGFVPTRTFVQYSQVIFGVSSGVGSVISTVIVYWHILQLFELIDDFKNVIKNRQDNPESRAIYEETNESIEKYTSLMNSVSKFTINATMITNLALTLLAYFTTGLDDYDYNFLLPLWFPFKKSLYEYAFEFVISYVGFYFTMSAALCMSNFLITSTLMTVAYIKDLRMELSDLNAIDLSAEKSREEEVREKISRFIQLHVHAKQHVSKTVDIHAPIFTMIFLWGLMAICVSLLTSHHGLSKAKPDYNVLFYVVLYIVYSFGIVFAYCEIGHQISSRFELLNDDIYQFNWHLLPIDLQRSWNIILEAAQQPVEFVGFGNIICSRETFKRIVNTSFSAFMIFRKFS